MDALLATQLIFFFSEGIRIHIDGQAERDE